MGLTTAQTYPHFQKKHLFFGCQECLNKFSIFGESKISISFQFPYKESCLNQNVKWLCWSRKTKSIWANSMPLFHSAPPNIPRIGLSFRIAKCILAYSTIKYTPHFSKHILYKFGSISNLKENKKKHLSPNKPKKWTWSANFGKISLSLLSQFVIFGMQTIRHIPVLLLQVLCSVIIDGFKKASN